MQYNSIHIANAQDSPEDHSHWYRSNQKIILNVLYNINTQIRINTKAIYYHTFALRTQ